MYSTRTIPVPCACATKRNIARFSNKEKLDDTVSESDFFSAQHPGQAYQPGGAALCAAAGQPGRPQSRPRPRHRRRRVPEPQRPPTGHQPRHQGLSQHPEGLRRRQPLCARPPSHLFQV